MTDNNNLSNSISLFSDPTTSEDMGTIQSKFNEFNKSNKSPKKKIRQEPHPLIKEKNIILKKEEDFIMMKMQNTFCQMMMRKSIVYVCNI